MCVETQSSVSRAVFSTKSRRDRFTTPRRAQSAMLWLVFSYNQCLNCGLYAGWTPISLLNLWNSLNHVLAPSRPVRVVEIQRERQSGFCRMQENQLTGGAVSRTPLGEVPSYTLAGWGGVSAPSKNRTFAFGLSSFATDPRFFDSSDTGYNMNCVCN